MLSYIRAERASPAEFDEALVWTALILLLLGMMMVYSASIATAEASRFTGNQPTYFLSRHALFLGVSLVAALMAFQVPVNAWQSLSPWLATATSAPAIFAPRRPTATEATSRPTRT